MPVRKKRVKNQSRQAEALNHNAGGTREEEREKEGSWNATNSQERFSQADGEFESMSAIEGVPFQASQEYVCTCRPTMLSHWLGAAHKKHGLVIDVVVDPEGSSWGHQTSCFPWHETSAAPFQRLLQ